jgi:nucleotidyltransferase substrate binding protein (TIGR01987 family)
MNAENQDVRWKQRFQNFEKSMNLLSGALAVESPDIYQRAGTIQFFETTYELAWKLMKDYLEAEGFLDVKSPRAVVKTAFQSELIEDGQAWMELLNDRNLTAHTYNEETADNVLRQIRGKYHPLLNTLYQFFKAKKDA